MTSRERLEQNSTSFWLGDPDIGGVCHFAHVMRRSSEVTAKGRRSIPGALSRSIIFGYLAVDHNEGHLLIARMLITSTDYAEWVIGQFGEVYKSTGAAIGKLVVADIVDRSDPAQESYPDAIQQHRQAAEKLRTQGHPNLHVQTPGVDALYAGDRFDAHASYRASKDMGTEQPQGSDNIAWQTELGIDGRMEFI